MDERLLAQHLRDTRAHDEDLIRYFLSMSLLAAHERKVTREYMIEVINLVAKLHASLTYFSTAASICHMMDRLGHSPELLHQQGKPRMVEYFKLRGELANAVELLAECPGPDDTVS